ncbi:MAG: glycosyltransferase, partial [Lachnospiraceae bacterium]|nr:glycosyltransferase [Lachnospiraceae bacterium]
QHGFKVNGQYLSDYMGAPFYDYIVDHPMRHTIHLMQNLKDFYVICLDLDHVNYIKNYFPNIKDAYMLPLGGWYNEGTKIKPIADRKYDVVLTGSYYKLSDIEAKIVDNEQSIIDLCVETINYMLANRYATNEEAMAAVVKNAGITLKPTEFAYYMGQIEKSNYFINAYAREEIVRYLIDSGVKLELFGNGWDQLDVDDWKNTTVHKGVTYEETADIYADSKIVLNTMPWFKNGLHDRVPTAMLNGAVAVTDATGYLIDNVKCNGDDAEVITYDIAHPESVSDVLNAILADEEYMQAVADRGREKALATMTWEKRVDGLVEIILGNL